jgi:hypothetical protein
MSDETSLSPLEREKRRVMIAFSWYVNDHHDSDSEYAVIGYEVLKGAIPDMTDEEYRRVTGYSPPQSECSGYPLSCCGYCDECESHHEDVDTDCVCDRGYCHDCEHTCEHC